MTLVPYAELDQKNTGVTRPTAASLAVLLNNIEGARWTAVLTQTLAYDAQTGNFTPGLIATGGTSGATALILSDADAGATGTLTIWPLTGTFINDEAITDTSTGAAVVNGTAATAASGVLARATSNAVGQTASTSSVQGGGPITKSYNVYSTVGTAGDCATLPAVFGVGDLVYIKNDAASNSMDVFPSAGDNAGAGTNTAVAVAAGNFAVFMGIVANSTWTKIMGGTA